MELLAYLVLVWFVLTISHGSLQALLGLYPSGSLLHSSNYGGFCSFGNATGMEHRKKIENVIYD